jgi:hypothetical protein
MLTSFSHLAQLVSNTTQITKAAILHTFLTMDKVKTDKIFSYLLCCVCVCIITKLKQEEKKVCLYGQLPELSGCQLLNVDAMQSLHQVEMSVGCILGSSHCLLCLFFFTVKMNGCIVDLAFSGEPKAIPWTHVTPLRCSTDAWAHQDIRYGDVFAWPTNLGWMMGPYLIFGSFLNGATIALYNGAPHGHSFGKFVQVCATYWNSFAILTVLHFILILI